MMQKSLTVAALFALTVLCPAVERASLAGKVTDAQGKPLENATVMIFHAGVKSGYSTFCPSCYVDCGKRAVTDRAGAFHFQNLDPDLRFELLVVREGYAPTFVEKVDPAQGPAPGAILTPRHPVTDTARVARGRVVDSHGRPMRDAVVTPRGVSTGEGSMYGTIDGLEPIAVTNSNGEFELANSDRANGILVQVEARAMAPKMFAVPTGAVPTTITVSDGSIVRGRLMNHGKPVAGAQLGLFPQHPAGFGMNLKISGDPYEEIRIGTQPDGTFVITNVPAHVDWFLYGKMDSITALGATKPVRLSTKQDDEQTNIGDIEIQPGYRLAGKVALSDGAKLAAGMRVTISATEGFDSQTALLGADGRFEFHNVPPGDYELFPSVKGYALRGDSTMNMAVDRDRNDIALTLDPAQRR
jgi:hypothetical protein